MPDLAVYALLAVTPALALTLAARLLDRWARGHGRGLVGLLTAPRPVPPAPGVGSPELARLTESLRRLEGDYRRIAASDLPGRVGRMRTVARAYDDTLRECCRALGLPEPADPLDGLARLETEVALTQHGVRW